MKAWGQAGNHGLGAGRGQGHMGKQGTNISTGIEPGPRQTWDKELGAGRRAEPMCRQEKNKSAGTGPGPKWAWKRCLIPGRVGGPMARRRLGPNHYNVL